MADTIEPETEAEPMTPQSALQALAGKQPLVALAAVFVMAGGGGTLGSMYVAPLVDSALKAHEADARAHQIDRLEDRLHSLEAKIDEQGAGLIQLQAGVETTIRILESK